jgi:hypothetical protein
LPPLPFPLDKEWQAEGELSGLPGYRFRARRLFNQMQLMQFPRYINRGSRDFFYLTERYLVPGAPLASAFTDDPSEGKWQLADRAKAGFPYAAATTYVRPDPARPETKVRVLKVDLKALAASTNEASTPMLRLSLPPISSKVAVLALKGGRAALVDHVASDVTPLVGDDGATATSAAWGSIAGELLVYAEVVTARDPARDRALLARVLDELGADQRVFSEHSATIALDGDHDLAGHPIDTRTFAAPGRRVLSFVRQPWKAERRLFTDTPIVPPGTWYYAQKTEGR